MSFRFSDLPIKSGHLFIGLAVIMGLLTIVLFNGARKSVPDKKQVVQSVETVKIVVPSVPIMQGEVVSRDDVAVVEWPSAFLPKYSYFTKTHELVGRVAKQNLLPGEPIFKQKIASKDASGLPALIPAGHRAVTVAVSEIKGVAGFVKPGDRVDILSTFEVEDQSGGDSKTFQMTRTLLQNALVLASAQSMVDEGVPKIDTPEGVERGGVQIKEEEADKAKKSSKKDKKKELSAKEREKERKARDKERKEAEKKAKLVSSVTLALLPADAERLALAEETGTLRLVLRPDSDYTEQALNGVEFGQLIGVMAPPKSEPMSMPPAPPISDFAAIRPPMGNQVELIEGTSKSSVSF